MKIKYRISDGEVICIGPMPDLQAGVGEAVEQFSGEIPVSRVDFFKRVGPNQLVEKSQPEKDTVTAKEKKFTKQSLKAYVNQGNTPAEKIDRLINILATLADKVTETDVP